MGQITTYILLSTVLSLFYVQFSCNSKSSNCLLIEAFSQLFEKEVTVRVRSQDRTLIQELFPTIATKYQDATGKSITLKIDNDTHLASESTGGVELYAQRNKIKINNTLEARLDLIAQQLVPEIRTALFGRNVNRKFTD